MEASSWKGPGSFLDMSKKSFILHVDTLGVLDELTDEQAGKLFKAIYAYQNEQDIELDFGIKMAFMPFKIQFERDNQKWEETREKRAMAGKMGGVSKASKSKQVLASASKSKQNTPVSVSVSVSESVSEIKSISKNNIEIHPIQKFVSQNCPNVSNLKTQLTFENCLELEKKYSKELIEEKLKAMENKKDLARKYVSVYLTLNTWCRDYAGSGSTVKHSFTETKNYDKKW